MTDLISDIYSALDVPTPAPKVDYKLIKDAGRSVSLRVRDSGFVGHASSDHTDHAARIEALERELNDLKAWIANQFPKAWAAR